MLVSERFVVSNLRLKATGTPIVHCKKKVVFHRMSSHLGVPHLLVDIELTLMADRPERAGHRSIACLGSSFHITIEKTFSCDHAGGRDWGDFVTIGSTRVVFLGEIKVRFPL